MAAKIPAPPSLPCRAPHACRSLRPRPPRRGTCHPEPNPKNNAGAVREPPLSSSSRPHPPQVIASASPCHSERSEESKTPIPQPCLVCRTSVSDSSLRANVPFGMTWQQRSLRHPPYHAARHTHVVPYAHGPHAARHMSSRAQPQKQRRGGSRTVPLVVIPTPPPSFLRRPESTAPPIGRRPTATYSSTPDKPPPP